MKPENFYRSLSLGRGCGKTTALAEACKKIGATMLCINQQQAKDIALKFGIKTAVTNSELRGVSGPFLYDHYAVEQFAMFMESKLEEANTKISDLEDRIRELINKDEYINEKD